MHLVPYSVTLLLLLHLLAVVAVGAKLLGDLVVQAAVVAVKALMLAVLATLHLLLQPKEQMVVMVPPEVVSLIQVAAVVERVKLVVTQFKAALVAKAEMA